MAHERSYCCWAHLPLANRTAFSGQSKSQMATAGAVFLVAISLWHVLQPP
jgi:hypothetical protein